MALAHNGRTRVRFSVNAREAERHEGGAPRMPQRLAALRAMAQAGLPGRADGRAHHARCRAGQTRYDRLFARVAEALDGVPGVDLTAELITHRFTPKSKGVLAGWYPGSPLEMDEAARSRKTTKFGR